MSKCFCHLNGYEVKDKEARAAISNLNSSVSAAQSAATNAANAASALEGRVTTLEGNTGGGNSRLYHVIYSITGGTTSSNNTSNFLALSLYMTETPPSTMAELETYLVNKYGQWSSLTGTGYITTSNAKEPIVTIMIGTGGRLSLGAPSGQSATLSNVSNFYAQVTEV